MKVSLMSNKFESELSVGVDRIDMLVKIIHMVLTKTRVTVVNVTEPPLRGGGGWGTVYGSFLNHSHYEAGYNRSDWGTILHPKDLFIMDVVVFEVVVIENKIILTAS